MFKSVQASEGVGAVCVEGGVGCVCVQRECVLKWERVRKGASVASDRVCAFRVCARAQVGGCGRAGKCCVSDSACLERVCVCVLHVCVCSECALTSALTSDQVLAVLQEHPYTELARLCPLTPGLSHT